MVHVFSVLGIHTNASTFNAAKMSRPRISQKSPLVKLVDVSLLRKLNVLFML